jgi:hypothetical protein
MLNGHDGKRGRRPAVKMMYPARKCPQGSLYSLMRIVFLLDKDLTNPNCSR